MIPQKSENLKGFGISRINVLALFYGQATTIAGELGPQNVCQMLYTFSMKLTNYLSKKCKQQSELTSMQQNLDHKIKFKEALESITRKN